MCQIIQSLIIAKQEDLQMDFDAWMKDFSKGLDNLADGINVNPTIQVSADTNLIGIGVGNEVEDVFIDQSQNNSTQQKALAEVDDYQGPWYSSSDNLADGINVNPTIQVSADTNLIGIGVGNRVEDVFIDQSQNNFTSQFAEAEVG
jgi:hypothetical protein